MDYELNFLRALIFTIIVETSVLFVYFKYSSMWNRNMPATAPRIVMTGFICSAFTLPYIWFIIAAVVRERFLFEMSAEIFALIAETVLIVVLLSVDLRRAFLISFACNISSFGLGKILGNIVFT